MSNFIRFLAVENESAVTAPLYKFIVELGPYVLGVLLVLAILYSIILGVQYAKSESNDDRKAAQKKLISFVIGAVVILLLIVILMAIREPLSEWAKS